ncbi:uncharacterized protein LOC123673359 [Harmonia axyridis]|uniref:uncharacterized protein LOC123673359 n=1 Tax=Harmonia axyridis TaxID=115357 RepID=UPI001E27528A|nr:uncharacterized protein LOC123673359 [Harmonia axyridis]
MGFYQDISTGYSEEVAQHLKKWSSQRGKLASAYNRRIFLSECKRQVLNSDKGSVTVIIERETYKQKMYEIVNSESFRTLRKDPTLTLQTKSNNYIKKLQDLNILSAERAKALKSYNSVCPKIYGNPKLHKRDCPLRPIVSSINSPTSNISMFMTEVLTQTYDRENEYFIKDTFEFATFVNNFRLEEDYVLISLDVVNLFGNLCEEVVVDVLNQRWGSISRNCDIPKDLFFEVIRFILRNNYFSFDNQYYIQIFGCAMGSKISPILAQYVMDHALDMCVPKLRHKIAFIKKFVDDLIVALHKQDVEIILEQFNSYNPHIQFTIEFEDENNSKIEKYMNPSPSSGRRSLADCYSHSTLPKPAMS